MAIIGVATQSLMGTGQWGAAQAVTISGDALALTGPGRYTVSSEAGVTDDLDSITGLSDGDEIVLEPATGHTITIKQGTGIKIKYDFAISGDDTATLLCEGSNVCKGKGWLADNE